MKSSQFFNNQQFAQAASNLASLFEPPSGADAAGWAAANEKKLKTSELQRYFDYKTNPNYDQATADRMGVGLVYNPDQSYYSVDQGNATTRRGQDVTAATSRANNADDNVRALETNAADNTRALETNRLSELGKFYQPLNEGQVRPDVPTDIAGQFGVDHPLPAAQGRDKARSETEVQGDLIDKMRRAGLITDDMVVDRYVGDKAPVETVGPEGKPVYMAPGAAARTGAPAYEKPAGAGMTTTLPDGTVIQMGGKPTDAQLRSGYVGTMSIAPTLDLLSAYDTGKLPNATDFQMFNLKKIAPDAFAPVLNDGMSDAGQAFYQNLSNVLPYQLMAHPPGCDRTGVHPQAARVGPGPWRGEGGDRSETARAGDVSTRHCELRRSRRKTHPRCARSVQFRQDRRSRGGSACCTQRGTAAASDRLPALQSGHGAGL
ncbi:hypothetical protein AJ88_31895 [Mesorhizobium amorphae CCBAU 01583]|nr:hypothetical protein AJ88_31895 [Mesorhizobium amorphae CCBAU 01583]